MPICEADPWRLQYFETAPCPADVFIPTEDADAWSWFPDHRWVYDKLAVARSQGLPAAPHGVMPPCFPVFSKPIVNLSGMGIGSRDIDSAEDYREAMTPGHFWMEKLTGEHVSTDLAIEDGQPVWSRHTTGLPGPAGTFDHWTIHAEERPDLDMANAAWVAGHMSRYTGMINLETIGGKIIEVHLRFADQWPDLYGPGWVEALIGLYTHGHWQLTNERRRTGFSVVLFGPPAKYRHPPPERIASLLTQPGISSVQITFHQDRAPERHAMPPGGFRLAIINCTNLASGLAARAHLSAAFGILEEQ